MRFLLKYLKKYRWFMAGVMGIKLMGTLLELLLPYVMEYLIDTVAPDSPKPQNNESFDFIDDITQKTLSLENGDVSAYAIKYKERRTHYRFVYEGCLFSVWDYSENEIGDDFWNGFSVENYN